MKQIILSKIQRHKRAFICLIFLCLQGDDDVNQLRKKRLCEMKNKIFEKQDYLQNADYKDLQSFITDFLNESDKKRRKKLIEEFKKRHLELYEFLKNNADLINAETEISKIIHDISNPKSDNSDIISKLDEVLGEIEDEF